MEGMDMEVFWGDLLEMHSARYDKNVHHAFTKSGSSSAIHLIHWRNKSIIIVNCTCPPLLQC